MESAARAFEVAHCLGRGGFGEVYRATMRTRGGLESEVALKVLRRDVDPSGQAVQRLRDEGRLLAKLDHPVILRVLDLALLDGRVALITEYIAGEDVETLLKGSSPIGLRALLEVVGKVAHALDAAWNAPLRDGTALRLVHRDIKPSNMRIGKHGEVKLLDFGIAKTDAVAREARTATDMLIGSPGYMAPERFSTTEVMPASDVFALGATLYEGLVRRTFYGRLDFPRIAGLAMSADAFDAHLAARVAEIPDDTPDAVRALVGACLGRDPAARPTAAELADRCEILSEEVPGPTLARWCRSRTWRAEKQESAELSGRTVSDGSLEQVRPQPVTHTSSEGATLERPLPVGPEPGAPPERPGVAPETVFVRERSTLRPIAPPQSEPDPPSSLPPAAVRGGRPWLAAVGLVLVVGLAGGAGLLVAGLGGLALNAWQGPAEAPADAGPTPEDPGAPDPDPGEIVAPAPAPAPAPEPTPAPAPAPARPAPMPGGGDGSSPAPAPAPAPAPGLVPAPAPDPVPATAHVAVTGGVPVVAIGAAGTIQLPADLAPGTWILKASFPGTSDPVPLKKPLDVIPGQRWTVDCNPRMFQCGASLDG